MVFQSYALYPHMNVADNMSFGLQIAGMPKPERDKKVPEVARILHLEPLLQRKPKELSGVSASVGSRLELYHHPNNRFVAGFIGSPKMNFLKYYSHEGQ